MRGRFREDVIRLDLSGFGLDRTDEDLFKDHYKMLTMGQLQYAEDSLLRHFHERAHRAGALPAQRPVHHPGQRACSANAGDLTLTRTSSSAVCDPRSAAGCTRSR